MMGRNARLILTTEAGVEAAELIAAELLERQIVACVTMFPVRSTYRWHGQIESTDEVQLVVKTTSEFVERVLDAVTDIHSYEVPEMLVLDADAAGTYGMWLDGILDSPRVDPR